MINKLNIFIIIVHFLIKLINFLHSNYFDLLTYVPIYLFNLPLYFFLAQISIQKEVKLQNQNLILLSFI